MRLLQGRPLHVRRRIAVIATGSITVVLILVMIYLYTLPQKPEKGPEEAITGAYATLLEKIQSLFHRK